MNCMGVNCPVVNSLSSCFNLAKRASKPGLLGWVVKFEPEEEFNDSQDNMEDPLKLDLSRQPTRKILTKKIEEKEAKV